MPKALFAEISPDIISEGDRYKLGNFTLEEQQHYIEQIKLWQYQTEKFLNRKVSIHVYVKEYFDKTDNETKRRGLLLIMWDRDAYQMLMGSDNSHYLDLSLTNMKITTASETVRRVINYWKERQRYFIHEDREAIERDHELSPEIKKKYMEKLDSLLQYVEEIDKLPDSYEIEYYDTSTHKFVYSIDELTYHGKKITAIKTDDLVSYVVSNYYEDVIVMAKNNGIQFDPEWTRGEIVRYLSYFAPKDNWNFVSDISDFSILLNLNPNIQYLSIPDLRNAVLKVPINYSVDKLDRSASSHILYIVNVPDYWTEDKLRKLFEPFIEPEFISMLKFKWYITFKNDRPQIDVIVDFSPLTDAPKLIMLYYRGLDIPLTDKNTSFISTERTDKLKQILLLNFYDAKFLGTTFADMSYSNVAKMARVRPDFSYYSTVRILNFLKTLTRPLDIEITKIRPDLPYRGTSKTLLASAPAVKVPRTSDKTPSRISAPKSGYNLLSEETL